jgi:porin
VQIIATSPLLCVLRRVFFGAAVVVGCNVAAIADDQAPIATVPSAGAPQTLTSDWFGTGQDMRNAGFDTRIEWSQFFQGMPGGTGAGDKTWEYGGKWDIQERLDLAKLGLWNGLSITGQFVYNYGNSVNGIDGSLLPVNAALYFPGIQGADASDLMAFYVRQDFGTVASLLIGKLNFVEFARATPLRGGGGVDTFWNVNLATPVSGLTPPTVNGAQLRTNTQPLSYSLTVFDPLDATNRPLFNDLFETGVSVMGTATLQTTIAGETGYYGIKGIYSTREGLDLSELIPSVINDVTITKSGSYYVGLSMHQYLIHDPNTSGRGWGVFGEITKADGNPNTLQWSTYFGVGGSSLIPSRPDDRFGVAYFRYGMSNDLKNDLAPIFDLTDESGLELFYNVAVTPWLRVTADLQFVRPATGSDPGSIYAGLGTNVRF